MGSTGAGASRAPVSATRQCVCGGWTRYIVCQYCGTTDPHAAAAGMISMTPLMQRSPEEAAAHSAGAASTGYDAGASREPGGLPAAFAEAGTHSAPPLPPTTFAEAQFGAAPSAAAVFASTADAPSTPISAFASPSTQDPAIVPAAPVEEPAASSAGSAFTGGAFSSPVPVAEPVPGWGEAPVPAPPGWASAPVATAPYEPGAAAPAPVRPAESDSFNAPALDAPPAAGPVEPMAVAYPAPPTSYEPPPELAAPTAPQALETSAHESTGEAHRSRRSLPRWAIPAAAAVVVLGGVGLYLSNSGGSSSDAVPAPVHHVVRPTTAVTHPGAGTAAASTVPPATRLTQTAPAGFTAAAAGIPVAAAGLPAADSVHSAAELSTAGVSAATVTTFTGPGGVKITALVETAGSPAQAATLAMHAHHFGFTMQAANGSTVYALHSLAKTAPIVTALTSWTTALHG